MKILSLVLLSAIILTGFIKSNPKQNESPFVCILSTSKDLYKIGEVPKFEVRILNKSNKDVYLIGSLDGSDHGRMPNCFFSIEKPKPETIGLVGRCGFENPLRIEDFKLVKKNDSFNPYENIDNYGFFSDYNIARAENFRNRGIYKIQFHYSTNSEDICKFIGSVETLDELKNNTQVKNLFAKVPKISLESNIVEIKIE